MAQGRPVPRQIGCAADLQEFVMIFLRCQATFGMSKRNSALRLWGRWIGESAVIDHGPNSMRGNIQTVVAEHKIDARNVGARDVLPLRATIAIADDGIDPGVRGEVQPFES